MNRLLMISLLSVCSPALAQQAPTFRGDAAHTGIFPASGTAEFHKIKWQFHTGGQILSSPVVADGVVYFGSNDHFLYAVDLASGAQKWKFETGSRIPSTPAVANGLLFFLSCDSNFYALDAATGALKWKFKTGDVVHASPAISGGTLFVGSWDTFFYALDAATGAQKWRFKTGEDHEIFNQTGIQASPALADGTVYFGCRDSNFYALDVNSGKQKWVFSNNGSWVIGSAAIQDGKVYFATSDTGLVRALDAKSGEPLFTIDFNHWPMFSSPAIAGKILYVGTH